MNNPHRYKSIIGSDKANPKKEVKNNSKKSAFFVFRSDSANFVRINDFFWLMSYANLL